MSIYGHKGHKYSTDEPITSICIFPNSGKVWQTCQGHKLNLSETTDKNEWDCPQNEGDMQMESYIQAKTQHGHHHHCFNSACVWQVSRLRSYRLGTRVALSSLVPRFSFGNEASLVLGTYKIYSIELTWLWPRVGNCGGTSRVVSVTHD